LPNLFLKPAEHGELTPATGAFQPIGAWPLSPATLRKEGPSFDLPIVLVMESTQAASSTIVHRCSDKGN
jgi:hypothetical protein